MLNVFVKGVVIVKKVVDLDSLNIKDFLVSENFLQITVFV